jgi:hypothetical protein
MGNTPSLLAADSSSSSNIQPCHKPYFESDDFVVIKSDLDIQSDLDKNSEKIDEILLNSKNVNYNYIENPLLKYFGNDANKDFVIELFKVQLLQLLEIYYKKGFLPLTYVSIDTDMQIILYQYLLFVIADTQSVYNETFVWPKRLTLLTNLLLLEHYQHVLNFVNESEFEHVFENMLCDIYNIADFLYD